MNSQPAKSWIELNARAYEDNLRTIESRLKEGVTLCAVVKANAYGHGIATVVEMALRYGIRCFGVDSIDEAIEVRRKASDTIIFVLGYTVQERFRDLLSYKLIPTLYTAESISALAQEARSHGTTAQINLKIETGTNRQGVREQDLKAILADIERNRDALSLVGVASHFSSSEDPKKEAVTKEQNERFVRDIQTVQRLGFDPPYRHISCSASTFLYPETHHTMVRIGLAQHGIWTGEDLRHELLSSTELSPVLSWKARIAQVKDVPTGESVGYGQSFVGDRPLRIAIVPVGYYDGYLRSCKGKAFMLVRGQKCRVIGSICMNMCMIDVSAVPGVHQDDVVTLIGRDGLNQITVDDLATWMGTINHEIPTNIKPHLPRIIV